MAALPVGGELSCQREGVVMAVVPVGQSECTADQPA